MKINELYESLLEEGISSVVFHSTSVVNFINMLKTNEIRLAPTFTKDAEMLVPNKGKSFFLSTTRTRTGKYHQGSNNIVLLKLDGRKLSTNLSGAPIDYWGADYRQYGGGEYEQEDRVFSNKDSIKGFDKYILSADIVLPYSTDARDIRRISNILTQLKVKKIPVRVFRTPKDMVAQQNELSVQELLDMFSGAKGDSREHASYPRRKITHKAKHHDYVIAMFYALTREPTDKFSPEQHKHLYQLIKSIMWNDISGISADLHNAQNDARYRNLLRGIADELRKLKLNSWKDALPHIKAKWSGKI